MSKYTPLENYLRRQPLSTTQVVLTFAKIEEIISDRLPDCARKYKKSDLISLRFWDNLAGASEADARLNAGFQTVMVDMENEKVRLRRI